MDRFQQSMPPRRKSMPMAVVEWIGADYMHALAPLFVDQGSHASDPLPPLLTVLMRIEECLT